MILLTFTFHFGTALKGKQTFESFLKHFLQLSATFFRASVSSSNFSIFQIENFNEHLVERLIRGTCKTDPDGGSLQRRRVVRCASWRIRRRANPTCYSILNTALKQALSKRKAYPNRPSLKNSSAATSGFLRCRKAKSTTALNRSGARTELQM